jgi:hypothetical protein
MSLLGLPAHELALAGFVLLVTMLSLGTVSTVLALRFHEIAAETGFARDLACSPTAILVLGWTATFDLVARDAPVACHRPDLARTLFWIRQLNRVALVLLAAALLVAVLAFARH